MRRWTRIVAPGLMVEARAKLEQALAQSNWPQVRLQADMLDSLTRQIQRWDRPTVAR